jgi:hypothetical protein
MGLCRTSTRQLPDLRRGKRAAPVAAVVPRGPKSAPAPHTLRLLDAVVRTEVVVMVMVVRGGGGDGGGGRGGYRSWGSRPPRGLEVLARWDRERRGAVGTPVCDKQRMGRRKTREREQECTRRAGIRGRLCLGIVSIEEENVGMGDELSERETHRQRGGGHVKGLKKGAHCFNSLLRATTYVYTEHALRTPPPLTRKSIQSFKIAQRCLDGAPFKMDPLERRTNHWR